MNWKFTLNISHVWNNDNLSVEDKGKAIAKVMSRTFPNAWFNYESRLYNEELEDIIAALENITGYDDTSPVEEFDGWWEEFYNWADQKVNYDTKMCWVQLN